MIEAGASQSFVVDNDGMSLQDIVKIPENEEIRVFQYEGSLTTPPCTENVHWMIVTTPSMISSHDLEKLRQLQNPRGENIRSNVRPTQIRSDPICE